MALRLIESFDNTASTYFYPKYTQDSTNFSNISTSYGRIGGYGMSVDTLQYNFNNQATWIIGFAFKLISVSVDRSYNLIELRDGIGNLQLAVNYGHLSPNILKFGVFRNTTLLKLGSTILFDRWYFLEFKATINSSTGSYELRLDGNNICSDSNVNTSTSGNPYANIIKLNASHVWQRIYIDDIYICDGSGSINNNFLGDGVVKTLVPNEEGTYSQFTPSSGSNFSCVNDLPTNNTNYVESYTVNHKDSYRYQDLNISGTIRGIGVNVISRKQNLSNINYRPFIITNSTIYTGTQKAIETLTTDYNNIQNIWEVNPYTTNSWSVSDINNLECGVELVG